MTEVPLDICGEPYVRELPSLGRLTMPWLMNFRSLWPGRLEFCDDDCSKRANQDEEAR